MFAVVIFDRLDHVSFSIKVLSLLALGFSYVTNTQCLYTHHFLRCRTAGFVQSMFVLMDV